MTSKADQWLDGCGFPIAPSPEAIKVREMFAALTDDERCFIAEDYCPGCGRPDRRCPCENDE